MAELAVTVGARQRQTAAAQPQPVVAVWGHGSNVIKTSKFSKTPEVCFGEISIF